MRMKLICRKVFPVATNAVTSLVTEKLKVVNGLLNL